MCGNQVECCCSIWDIEEGTKLGTNYNSQARITAAEFINPHDITFLLTGSGKFSRKLQIYLPISFLLLSL